MKINREELANIFRNVFPFYGLNMEETDVLLNSCEVVLFPAEKMIYIEGSPAVYFYIIVEGQVEVLKEKDRTLKQLNTVGNGFAFGEDALEDNKRRQTSARAKSDVVLVKIDHARISQIQAINRLFNKNLDLMVSTYNYLLSKDFSRGENETIFYVSQPHKLFLILKSVLTLITSFGIGILLIQLFNNRILSYTLLMWSGGLTTLFCLASVIWQFLEWNNDFFVFTDKRIINQQRSLFSFEMKQETPIVAVTSIQARKSIFGRMMNFGDLDVRTFTGSMRLPYVPEIILVEKIIAYLAARLKEFQSKEEKQAFENDIRERITNQSLSQKFEFSSDHQNALFDLSSSNNIENGKSELEQGNDIVYHTHWTVLFTKLFIPFSLLIAHILLYIFLWINHFAIASSSLFNTIIGINCFILIVWNIYLFIDWKNDVYIISDNLLIDYDRRPFGMEEKQTASIKNIQSIRYKRNGIFGLLLNFGTVFIRVGDEEFTFNNVYRPSDVQEELFAAKDRVQRVEEELEKRSQREKAVEWIDSYHRITKGINHDGANWNEPNTGEK